MSGQIDRLLGGLGSLAKAAWRGLTQPQYVACFVRKRYRTSDLLDQFAIPMVAFSHANPHLIGSPFVPSGRMILLPDPRCLNGPRDRSRVDDFDLSLTLASPGIFHNTVHKDQLRDRTWMPSKPPFKQANREALFGRFEYEDLGPNTDDIRITDGWDTQNVGSVAIPQLRRFKREGKTRFFKKAHEQLRGLFNAWEKAGLLGNILTWDGAFNPRYMRKATHDRAHLSNHSWGTAFDINAAWNKLGKPVARLGKPGCVLELVEIAYDYGFYWGGHFGGGRSDGMHFEVAKLL